MIVDLIPTWLAAYIPVFSLLAVGYIVEKHYVSRVTTFANALALTVFVITHNAGWIIGLYTDFGLLLGVVGLQAYRKSEKLAGGYYTISAVLYASVPVASVIVYPELKALLSVFLPSPGLLATAVVVLVFILNALTIESDESLIYEGARPIQVNEFISKAEFRFPNERRWYSVNDWFDIK